MCILFCFIVLTLRRQPDIISVSYDTLLGGVVLIKRNDIEILRKSFLFNDVTDDEFLNLEDAYKIVTFNKGELVFVEGEKCLGVILEGNATAVCSDGDKSSLKNFTPGEVFGAATVFCEQKEKNFSKIKSTSYCRVFFIGRVCIEKLIMCKPERAIKYIEFLSNRVEFLNKRISTFTSNQAVNRLAKYILDNAKDGVCNNVSFASVARNLDISRASFYRAKDELENSGAAIFSAKKITVVNENVLITFL